MVAAGEDGIDIYSIKEENGLAFWRTYQASDLKLVSLNAIDIACSEDGKTLYVLDQSQGLMAIDILYIESPSRMTMIVPIIHAVAFDNFRETFLIIAQSNNNKDYAVELFADFSKGTYY
jgi:hypothetical protein